MTLEKAKELKQGSEVYYAGSFYEFAELKKFPHGVMIGIYDEANSKHIDYLNVYSVKEVVPCGQCWNGCPVCGGSARIVIW